MTSDDETSKRSPSDLDDFGRKLKKAQETEESRRLWKSDVNRPPQTALGLAFRVSVELVSAVAVGLAIGWVLDEWLDTRPWVMVVFIILGFAAGVMNVYRMASGMSNTMGYREKEDASGNEAPAAPEKGTDRRG
ncbi:AtpZ/AtpI family protein [Thalassospiraceae bacterium LMO-JJ14]|nr:AtpZ/AtpI family protein [Thalassospiraceae bacterium LMO-JJ14]